MGGYIGMCFGKWCDSVTLLLIMLLQGLYVA